MPSDLVPRLQQHRTIGRVPREELEWVAAHGELMYLDQEGMDQRGEDGVRAMWVILSGHFSINVDRGTGPRRVLEWRGGDVSGLLPYSRMVAAPGYVVVHEPAEVVRVGREHFRELIVRCHEITSICVHIMLDRARQFTSHDFHAEKMLSLGRLAAGLAHELNNPASAVIRGAKGLVVCLDDMEAAERAVGAAHLPAAAMEKIERMHATHWADVAAPPRSPVEQSDREDAIDQWLRAHQVELRNPEALVRSTIDIDTLNDLASALDPTQLTIALRALSASRSIRHLAWQVETAASRIHSLVSAVRGFSRVDQAAAPAPFAVAQGLKDTLAVLASKAKNKSITVTLDVAHDLPEVMGVAGEINQVWANLIDNALDAAPEKGHVDVTATAQGNRVVVYVVDDGPGIPAELKQRIFDPFFTTKPLGEGTGLGLDIARRLLRSHDGQIEFDSRPGRTEFRVTLPAAPI